MPTAFFPSNKTIFIKKKKERKVKTNMLIAYCSCLNNFAQFSIFSSFVKITYLS